MVDLRIIPDMNSIIHAHMNAGFVDSLVMRAAYNQHIPGSILPAAGERDDMMNRDILIFMLSPADLADLTGVVVKFFDQIRKKGISCLLKREYPVFFLHDDLTDICPFFQVHGVKTVISSI